MLPDSYRKISASLVSPSNFNVGDIAQELHTGIQWEIKDYFPAPAGNRGAEYASVEIRMLPKDERVKPEFCSARLRH